VVSPHFDDAALSCAALLDRGEAVDVLTVCGGRPNPPRTGAWDRWTGFPDSDASTAARRNEEVAAFEGSPHRLATLDLCEAQYLEQPRPEADGQAVTEALTEWAGADGGTVAIPAGAGRRKLASAKVERLLQGLGRPPQHPDHLFVRDRALDAFAGREGIDVLLYEELPHLWGRKADREVAKLARSLGLAIRLLELPVDRRAKAERIAPYESQVPYIYPNRGRLDDERTLPPTERYWRLTPSTVAGAPHGSGS
jgi:hypothetical protein